MKKSFAENCIRYISTATALILALAMLCCANFSASAKDLGSNLTISDTTLLLKDINTTTNTTPAKTKDLIASGASVEIISGGATQDTVLYFAYSGSYDLWPENWGGTNNGSWYPATAVTGKTFDGKQVYSCALWSDSKGVNLHFKSGDTVVSGTGINNIINGESISNYKDKIYVLTSETSGSWQSYSGGSSGTTTKTVYFDNSESKWPNVYAWVWKSDSNGELVQLTRVGTTDVYSMEVSTDKDCVIFKQNSGSNFDAPRTGDLKSSDTSLPNNMADGYMFSFTNYDSTSAQNTGTWSEYSVATTYTVTFHANGHGSRPDAQTVTSGGKATVPTPPTAEGWTFVGWYTESSCKNEYNFDTPVTGNLNLYAKWTENASSDVSADIISVLKGEKIMFYIGSSYESGKTSAGIALYANNSYISASGVTQKTINSATHGYGYVTYASGKYNITNNKNDSWTGLTMDTDASAGGYYYIGDPAGHIDAQNAGVESAFTTVNNSTVSTSTTTGTTGISTSLNKLVYYLKSGDTYSQIATSTEGVNTYIESLADGNYTLYTCLSDGNITVLKDTDTFTKSSVVKYDVNVHYNSKGGTDYTSQVEESTKLTEPASKGVTGYTLEGWYTTATFDTGTKVTFPLTITGNTDLYAKWTANEYTVTFDYKDGTTIPTTTVVTYNKAYGELPNPTRTGYTFNGWYLEEEFTNKVTSTITVTTADNHTLYAKWTAKEYNITYVLNDGTINGDYATKYTYGVGATLPTDVTKDGYTFLGWKDDVTGDIVTEISTTDSGNKSFTAQWKLNTFEHQYVFLDASGCDWFYDNKCVGVVYFNNDNVAKTTTGYTEMKELFTDDSGYESGDGNAQHSKLLFAEVPSGTTKITFARHGSGDYNNNYNITNFGYSNFTTNNCFKITGGGNNDSSVSGTWSEKTYNPVPIDFSVVGNGSVAFKNTVSPEITVSNGGTIYADKASTALKVKATPSENYEVSVFTINTINSEDKLGSITDKSAGGTVDIGALSDNNTVEVTFKASANPIVTIPTVENSSVTFIYLDENGVSQTKENASGDYTVQFGSTITLNIIPNAGYYVKILSDNLTPTDTFPKADTITATATQVKENLIVSYELAENPTVTIKCYDSTGNEITSGAGITVDGDTDALTQQSKSVLYNSETGVTFTASADAEDVHHYRFLGYYTTTTPVGSPIESVDTNEYNVTVNGNSINVYNVKSDLTLYAIFSQQYKVTFNYENLTNFTVDGTAVATGGSVYVSSGANLTLVATISDDYKRTNDFWSITPTGIGTFTSNGLSATYVSGSGDVTITIKPEIATYTGQGKWGSKTLKIDTSGVKKDTPWFAVAFRKSATDTDNYFIRCSKVSDDLYECVIPDGYTHFDIYRMAKDAKAFTTDVETEDGKLSSTIAWNKTNSTTMIGSNTSYKLSFNGTVGQMSIATN